MVKKFKKAPVKPEMRRNWLRQVEEEGFSPPQIAERDHYDVRTVRKQLDFERQERERREARSSVLRNALEQHYADLCDFARRLSEQIASEKGSLFMLKNDRMWAALREHLPRSIIWKNLDRWEHLQEQIAQTLDEMKQSFEKEVTSRAVEKRLEVSEETGVGRGVPTALVFNCKQVAKGQMPLSDIADFKLRSVSKGSTDVELGAFNLGRVPDDQVKALQELFKELVSESTSGDEYSDLERLYAELSRIQRALDDEIALITLRRVVPGRCRYCPI